MKVVQGVLLIVRERELLMLADAIFRETLAFDVASVLAGLLLMGVMGLQEDDDEEEEEGEEGEEESGSKEEEDNEDDGESGLRRREHLRRSNRAGGLLWTGWSGRGQSSGIQRVLERCCMHPTSLRMGGGRRMTSFGWRRATRQAASSGSIAVAARRRY